MFNIIYLTPASISYLNQFLLSLVLATYLGWRFFYPRQYKPSKTDTILFFFMSATAVFSLLLFLDVSLSVTDRLYAVYLQNTMLCIMLILLAQFAVNFPRPPEKGLWVGIAATAFLTAYALWEAGFAVWRYSILPAGRVEYRPDYVDIFPALGFLLVIALFMFAAWRNWRVATSRHFALIFIIPLWLAVLNLVRTFYGVTDPIYHINMSVGVLFTIFLFSFAYLNGQPEKTTFPIKLSGAVLTSILAMFGIVVWLVAPAYASRYEPNLADERTLRFSPNGEGGYDVSEIPFHFEADPGQKMPVVDVIGENDQVEVEFQFPFYDRVYKSFFIHNDGIIAFGEKINVRNLQYRLSAVPAIFLGLTDLKPEASVTGGVFVKQEDDRLVVTFLSVPSFYYPEQEYTYQSVLYTDGTFEITHAGLPVHPVHRVNDRALASVWVVGAKPSLAPDRTVNFSSLPIQSGAEAVIQNEYLAFREYMHDFLQPLALAVFLVSLFFLLGLAALFKFGFAQPLDALLAGVQSFNSGERKLHLPIRYNDEIGFLTRSFNTLANELDDVLSNLEVRISDQTADLQATNERLRKLTIAIEQSPSSIVITNANGQIEYVNPAFTQISGYTSEETLGKNPRILKSGQTPEVVFPEMWKKITNGEVWRGELANQRKNGELYWEYTVIAPILDTEGNITHYVAIKEDVTDRHNTEVSLRESEEQYRQLFELESDAIFIIRNEDGRILQANGASANMYGYTVDELLTLSNSDLSAEPEQTKKATKSPTPDSQVVEIPLRWHRKKDGTIFPVEITARFIQWQGQQVHLAAIRDITRRLQAEKELELLAATDPLTGLFNRRYFDEHAEKHVAKQGDGGETGLLLMDIDYFKKINDEHGHEAGDFMLKELARLLSIHVRSGDILARYGGEEFALLLPRTSESEMEQVAERLRLEVERNVCGYMGKELRVTISVGGVHYSHAGAGLAALLRLADTAMYEAKQLGRNRCVFGKE